MATPIPVKNIYHLLCYAWDVLPPAGLVDIDVASTQAPIDLFAQVLITGTHHLLRRGVEQDYQLHAEEMATIRGKILLAHSARRMLLQQGRALCEFDELSPNTLPNQILKATHYRLSRLWGLDGGLRRECGKLVRQFRDVEDIQLTPQTFHRIQLHGNNRYYKFLNHVCELVYHECLLDDKSGSYRFQDFFREDGPMARLYEKFLFNFYKKRQSEYKVASERIRWDVISDSDPDLNLFPTMLTDISLRSCSQTLIIDAKYHSDIFQRNRGKKRFKSGNIYQIYAYLKNLEKNGGNDSSATGMLLYPVVSEEVSHSYQLDNHEICFETVNLSEDWDEIERKLLLLIISR